MRSGLWHEHWNLLKLAEACWCAIWCCIWCPMWCPMRCVVHMTCPAGRPGRGDPLPAHAPGSALSDRTIWNHCSTTVQPKFGTTVQHCSTPPRILNETSQREQCMMQYLVRRCAEMCRDVQMSSSCAHENMWKTVQDNRRKFRSQTSDNMDKWKAEMGRVREEKRRRKKITNEKVSEERRSRCTKR